jgi:catechol 2,3-dioxygenase-like lactoylglutathione lyase family enzyme
MYEWFFSEQGGNMAIPVISGHSIAHIGLIVRDIEKTAAEYARVFGIKVPNIGETDGREKTNMLFRGKPSDARAKLCHIPMGTIQTELIQPLGAPSVWREFLDAHGEGIHHVAVVVADSEGEAAGLEAAGFPVVQKGDFGTGRYVYVDTGAKLGVDLELIQVF